MQLRAEQLMDNYDEERDKSFMESFEDKFMKDGVLIPFTEEELQDFVYEFEMEYPTEEDWAFAQAEDEYITAQEAKYDAMKDEGLL
jgi:hypothetical protein